MLKISQYIHYTILYIVTLYIAAHKTDTFISTPGISIVLVPLLWRPFLTAPLSCREILLLAADWEGSEFDLEGAEIDRCSRCDDDINNGELESPGVGVRDKSLLLKVLGCSLSPILSWVVESKLPCTLLTPVGLCGGAGERPGGEGVLRVMTMGGQGLKNDPFLLYRWEGAGVWSSGGCYKERRKKT